MIINNIIIINDSCRSLQNVVYKCDIAKIIFCTIQLDPYVHHRLHKNKPKPNSVPFEQDLRCKKLRKQVHVFIIFLILLFNIIHNIHSIFSLLKEKKKEIQTHQGSVGKFPLSVTYWLLFGCTVYFKITMSLLEGITEYIPSLTCKQGETATSGRLRLVLIKTYETRRQFLIQKHEFCILNHTLYMC